MPLCIMFLAKPELCRAHTPCAPRPGYVAKYCNTLQQFYDLMTLSNIELEHAQSHQHTIMLKEWVWSINHWYARGVINVKFVPDHDEST